MINLEVFKAVNDVFTRLNILRRWTSFVTEDKYNELAKQAFNCLIAYVIACYVEQAGKMVCWDRFPKIALHRAFQKVYVYFDMPDGLINELCEVGGITKDAFDDVTSQIIEEHTNEDFATFLQQGLRSRELQVYRAATRIATYIELIENRNKIVDQEEYYTMLSDITKSIEKFYDIPGVKEISNINSNIFKVLQQISRLRNQNRWSVMFFQVKCNVLGHLFDVAMLAWLMALEMYPDDEKLASRMFFMGIFHDVAETWTTDIPSPIKDRIKGFRKVTEDFECKKLQENLYDKVPEFLGKAIKEVMFEEEVNNKYWKFIKGADYLSADSECWRQYRAGVRDPYFVGAIKRNTKKLANRDIEMSETGELLHQYFEQYADSLNCANPASKI